MVISMITRMKTVWISTNRRRGGSGREVAERVEIEPTITMEVIRVGICHDADDEK